MMPGSASAEGEEAAKILGKINQLFTNMKYGS
jgi:hypothetical protein